MANCRLWYNYRAVSGSPAAIRQLSAGYRIETINEVEYDSYVVFYVRRRAV